MSSSASDSESSYDSDEAKTRDYSDYEGEIEPSSEDEVSNKSQTNPASVSSDEEGALCADDPVADAEWFARYEQEMHEIRAHEKRMKDRLDGIIELREWYGQSYFTLTKLIVFISYALQALNRNLKSLYRCNCGNCSLELLQNVSECSCCREVQSCVDAMEMEEVLRYFPPGTKLKCVTEHPGFAPVCLQKWSLKQGAWKYKTRGNQRYKQTESEER